MGQTTALDDLLHLINNIFLNCTASKIEINQRELFNVIDNLISKAISEKQEEYVFSKLISLLSFHNNRYTPILYNYSKEKLLDIIKSIRVVDKHFPTANTETPVKEIHEEFLKFNFSNLPNFDNPYESIYIGNLFESEFLKEPTDKFAYVTFIFQEIKQSFEKHQTVSSTIFFPILADLLLARKLCQEINEVYLFYSLVADLFDTLNFNQYYSIANSIIPHVFKWSLEDSIIYIGFYLHFRIYHHTFNLLGSTISLIFLQYTIQGKIIDSDIYTIITSTICSFFSIPNNLILNALFPIIKPHFKSRESLIPLELMNFTSQYFKNITCSDELCNFFQINIDIIKNLGLTKVMAWFQLSMFVYEKELNPNLTKYIDELRAILPVSQINKIYFNDVSLEDIKNSVLQDIRNGILTDDILGRISYLKTGLSKFNRLIVKGFEEQNFNAFLLGHFLKSILGTYIASEIPSTIGSLSPEKMSGVAAKYGNLFEYYVDSTKDIDATILTISKVGSRVFYLNLKKNAKITEILDWDSKYIELLKAEGYSSLVFNDFESEQNGYRFLVNHDVETINLKDKLSFAKLEITSNKLLLISKDSELDIFPDNLFMNNHEFIIQNTPICNLVSLELLPEVINPLEITNDLKAWLPSENDLELEILRSEIAPYLSSIGFQIEEGSNPTGGMQASLLVIASHGRFDFSTFSVLNISKEESRVAITYLIKTGTVAVLLVCHSGSISKDFLQQTRTSAITSLFEKGFKTVIAPYWAVRFDIASIWIQAFTKHFMTGMYVYEAFYKANSEIIDKFKYPKAYICFHLYGNAFVKLNVKHPSLD